MPDTVITWEPVPCDRITASDLRADLDAAPLSGAICIRWHIVGCPETGNDAVYWSVAGLIGAEAGGNADYSATIGTDPDAAISEALNRYAISGEGWE
jgi:hypothetical protein